MPKELPARPNVEHLKSQAKDLLDAYRRGELEAMERFRKSLPSAHGKSDEALADAKLALHDAQSVIAREYGCATFAELLARADAAHSSDALRALMATHPNAPLPEQVIEAMAAAANAKPKPAPIASAVLPVVPLRGALVTPGSLVPINVGRPSSVEAIDTAKRGDSLVVVFAQKDAENENPGDDDLHAVGCVAQIVTTRESFVVLRGLQWVTREGLERTEPFIAARVRAFDIGPGDPSEVATLRERVAPIVAAMPGGSRIRAMLDGMNALELADATIANLACSVEDKARYASETTVSQRLTRALELLAKLGP
jgi:Lon protease-like protein